METVEIKLGGNKGLSTIVDKSDFDSLKLGLYQWNPISAGSTVYAKVSRNRKTILLHRLIMGIVDAPFSVYVDHIDHDGLNNTRSNLRVTNGKGNQGNRRKDCRTKNTSIYKGVSRVSKAKARSNPWQAREVRRYIGVYPTEVEAAQAYNKAATELFGGFAYLNVILDKETASAQDIQQAGKSPIAIRTST